MAKILFIDDDQEILDMCRIWFEGRHVIDCATTISGAMSHINLGGYDILVVDLGLPDGSGSQIVDQVRKKGQTTPILVLTGVDDINRKVDLLDTGADDYLTKPFHFKELEARLKALLRRPGQIAESTLAVGELSLNQDNATVSVGDQQVKLTPKEYALLEFFMRHPDQAFSQEVLIARVWPNDSETSPDVVRIYVQRLRRKLEKQSGRTLITNQRGHGYIFNSNQE